MIREVWKDIEGYNGKYQISNLGKIRSLYTISSKGKRYYRVKELKLGKTKKGYLQTRLCKNGSMKNGGVRVHRLVAIYFLPNFNSLSQVNHKDGNKENNVVNLDNLYGESTNLEWCTNQQNAIHAQERGLNPSLKRLSENYNAKSVNQYTLDGTYIRTYNCLKEAAIDCGLKNACRITTACKDWKHTSGGYRWRFKK